MHTNDDAFSTVSSAAKSGFFVNWFLIPLLRPVLINMRQMEEYLETSCQDINYTVVRPAGLKNGPLSGTVMQHSIHDMKSLELCHVFHEIL